MKNPENAQEESRQACGPPQPAGFYHKRAKCACEDTGKRLVWLEKNDDANNFLPFIFL